MRVDTFWEMLIGDDQGMRFHTASIDAGQWLEDRAVIFQKIGDYFQYVMGLRILLGSFVG